MIFLVGNFLLSAELACKLEAFPFEFHSDLEHFVFTLLQIPKHARTFPVFTNGGFFLFSKIKGLLLDVITFIRKQMKILSSQSKQSWTVISGFTVLLSPIKPFASLGV